MLTCVASMLYEFVKTESYELNYYIEGDELVISCKSYPDQFCIVMQTESIADNIVMGPRDLVDVAERQLQLTQFKDIIRNSTCYIPRYQFPFLLKAISGNRPLIMKYDLESSQRGSTEFNILIGDSGVRTVDMYKDRHRDKQMAVDDRFYPTSAYHTYYKPEKLLNILSTVVSSNYNNVSHDATWKKINKRNLNDVNIHLGADYISESLHDGIYLMHPFDTKPLYDMVMTRITDSGNKEHVSQIAFTISKTALISLKKLGNPDSIEFCLKDNMSMRSHIDTAEGGIDIAYQLNHEQPMYNHRVNSGHEDETSTLWSVLGRGKRCTYHMSMPEILLRKLLGKGRKDLTKQFTSNDTDDVVFVYCTEVSQQRRCTILEVQRTGRIIFLTASYTRLHELETRLIKYINGYASAVNDLQRLRDREVISLASEPMKY